MSHSEAVIPTACGCDCQEEEEFARRYEAPQEEEEEQEPENHVLGWKKCECPFCGPLLEDGSQKCKVQISPYLMCATAIREGFPKTGTDRDRVQKPTDRGRGVRSDPIE